jgi:hypothetical protein
MRTCLIVALLVLAAPAARADLEILNIQAVHGELGPVRTITETYPLDEIVYRFEVSGAKVNAEGKLDTVAKLRLTGPDGKVLVNNTVPLKGTLTFGGKSFPNDARLTLGEQAPPGDYLFKVTIEDNLANGSASFERKLTVKPAPFTIVRPRFYYDAEGKIPAPAKGVMGQTLHFRFSVLGCDRTKGEINTEMTLELFDKDGKTLLSKPAPATIHQKDPEIVKKVATLNFSGVLPLNRTGDFLLRVTVKDKLSMKTATFETPLHITNP